MKSYLKELVNLQEKTVQRDMSVSATSEPGTLQTPVLDALTEKEPNATTREAIEEAKRGNLPKFSSFQELLDDLKEESNSE